MIPTKSQKRGVENFVVAKTTSTTIPVTGTLVDSSTGNVNLADGQLGIVAASSFGSVALNSFMDATPTLAENAVIAIYQGTSASANVVGSTAQYPLWVRSFAKTHDIDGRNNNILVTKQAFRLAAHNTWVVGVPSSSSTGAINVLDETEYRLNIGFRSRRVDIMMGTQVQSANLPISVVSPDFTALAATYPLPIDWIVTMFGYEINRNSSAFLAYNRYRGSSPVVALAVGIANSGPSGAAAGTAISGLTAGSTLAIFNYKGVVRSITLTAENLASINAAATASGFTHVFTIDTANAGTATGGTATGLFIMALDHNTSFVDRIPEVKVNLQVALPSGFDYETVSNVEAVRPDEGQGYGRVLDLWYQSTQGQRLYAQRHTEDPVINFPSPVDAAQNYVTYVIQHGTVDNPDIHSLVYSPKRDIILIPRYSSGTTAHPSIALLDTALNSWLPTTGNAAILNLV